jgi:2-keto-4-pentenoate hydratase/2-oxohepta-3-ene-1,7-dioic acid hydratase in catechol pathway
MDLLLLVIFLPKKHLVHLENLTFELTNNDSSKGDSSLMLWKIDELIAYVSQYFT